MNNIIASDNLTKDFGKFRAVDGISLSVGKGEVYGFLGLNGAGKTTTIRMLLGMIRPSSGTAWLNGERIHSGNNSLWNKVGYVVEIPYSYPELTVRENLELIRRLRFISDPKAVDTVIGKLKLEPYRDRLAKHLSQGNAQRLGLAKAIMHHPEIIILDEPANGLDPVGIVEIRELIFDLAHNHGVTVFISSHILGEISKFATRIGIIHKGRLVQELDITKIEDLGNKCLMIDVHNKNGALSVLSAEGYSSSITEEGLIKIQNNQAILHPETVNALLVHAGYAPTLLKVEEEDLETYFLRVIGNNGNETKRNGGMK